jgi:hypothetical protein
MPQEIINVFVSSRMNGELDKERQMAIKTLQEIESHCALGLKPVAFEHEECPPSTTPRTASIEWVKQSDVLISIYYKTISPILVEEFLTAEERCLPIFIFVKRAKSMKGPELDAYHKLQEFLRADVEPSARILAKKSYVYKSFTDIESLRRAIIRAILKYAARRFDFKRVDKYIFSGSELENLRRTEEVFVRPSCYARTEETLANNRLVIISGPAHAGKTSLALKLGNSLKTTRIVRRFLQYPADGSLADLDGVKQSVLLFDDPFGGATFNPQRAYIGDNFESIIRLSSDNFVLVTSRKEILDEAQNCTKLGERANLEEYVVRLDPEDYQSTDRKQMLVNHMRYYNVSGNEEALLSDNMQTIIDGLSFPHSYEVLVRQGLKEITHKKKSLHKAVQEANEIEKVVSRWFLSYLKRDKEIFYFIFTLALFPETLPGEFTQAYSTLVDQLRVKRRLEMISPTIHDLKRLVRETSPYVSLGRTIKFSHPSYRQAVIFKISDEFIGDLAAAPACCEIMAKDDNEFSRQQAVSRLEEIGLLFPDEVIPMLVPILKSRIESDWRQEQSARSALFEFGKVLPDKVLPEIEDLRRNENWSVSDQGDRLLSDLGKLMPDKVIPLLLESIEEERIPRRKVQGICCLEKMLMLRFESILPFLRRWARDEDWNVRRAAALSLRRAVKHKPQDILPILEELLRDKEWLVRNAAEISYSNFNRAQLSQETSWKSSS